MSALRTILVVVSLASVDAWAQRCDAAAFSDTVCDCGCGTADSACPSGTFVVCQVSHCPPGQAPWEHSPGQCMSSACGDGWKDTASGEACDDGNALASGGCSADCRAVNPGYICGEGASKCRVAPMDAGTSTTDAGSAVDAGATTDAGSLGGTGPDAGTSQQADAGVTDSPPPSGGCATAPGLMFGLAALLAWRQRRTS